MIEITFDEIGEHIERGDMKEWLAELKVQNATKGLFIDDRKTEPTISKEEIISNAKLVGYQDGVKACNEEWLVRLGYKSQYDEPQGDILIPPHHTGFVQPIKQTERGE